LKPFTVKDFTISLFIVVILLFCSAFMTVNQMVAGSSPAVGATKKPAEMLAFFVLN
jgi:hypothetical protein